MICSTVAGSSASGRHMSVMIESPSTRIPACTATIDLGHGRHPDDVGADAAQKPILGARLEVRTRDRDVHAFAQA